ncbi:hypothetical protein ACOBR2_08445 [Telmatobacter bradus]|uniref:hypothetical protein n=1 Tax=Telmatobacter bradus TaxID=474953 RepID=UPI003B434BB5
MRILVLVLVGIFAGSVPLMADGGRIRMHEKSGPFLITLFTTPDPLVAGPADFSVAVERADRAGVVEDAEVTLLLTRPDGTHLALQATHGAATSRFLYAANLSLPVSGAWRVKAIVSKGDLVGESETRVDVLPLTSFGDQTHWQIAAVPISVLLFFLHQMRRRRLAGRRRRL